MEEEKKDQRDVLIGPGTDDVDLGMGKADNNGRDAPTVSQLTQTNDKEEEKEDQRDVLIGPGTDDAGLGTGKSDYNKKDVTTKPTTENDGTDIHPDDSLHPIHDDRPKESPAGEEKNIGNCIGQGCAIIMLIPILGVAIIIIIFVIGGLTHLPKIDNNDKSDRFEERIKTYQDDDSDTTAVYVKGIDDIDTFYVEGIDDETDDEVVKEVEDSMFVLESESEPEVLKEENSKVYDVVEQMPSFPGGHAALLQWLASNVIYPAEAAENGVQGRVIVQFVVEKDGSVSDAWVVKSVDPLLDKEARRVVSAMPRWNPGKQKGSAVRVKYTIPVTFKLQ